MEWVLLLGRRAGQATRHLRPLQDSLLWMGLLLSGNFRPFFSKFCIRKDVSLSVSQGTVVIFRCCGHFSSYWSSICKLLSTDCPLRNLQSSHDFNLRKGSLSGFFFLIYTLHPQTFRSFPGLLDNIGDFQCGLRQSYIILDSQKTELGEELLMRFFNLIFHSCEPPD